MERRPFEIFDSFAAGAVLSFGCQFGAAAFCYVLAKEIWPTAVWGIIGWGFLQWLIVLPLTYRLKRAGKSWALKGLVAGSLIGVLLSSACGAWTFMMIAALNKHTIPH